MKCPLLSIGAPAQQILFACALLAIAVIALALGVWYYRRRWLSDGNPSAAWTFDDLRRLREEGKLTQEEYQAIRASMIGSLRDSDSSPPGAKPASSTGSSAAAGDEMKKTTGG